MFPVSLATLRQDALLKADMVNTTGLFVGELDRYINQGITELYELLISSGQDYTLASETVLTVATTDTYALPFNFLAIKGVDIAIGGVQSFDAIRFNWAERNKYKLLGNGWFYDQPVYYDLRDSNIVFMPAPQGAYTVTLWYYPVPGVLSDPDDTVDCVNGWDEVITISSAIKLAEREESYDLADRLESKLAAVKARVAGMAPKRNAGEPPRVSRSRRHASRLAWGRRA